jgi:hypothetical protein
MISESSSPRPTTRAHTGRSLPRRIWRCSSVPTRSREGLSDVWSRRWERSGATAPTSRSPSRRATRESRYPSTEAARALRPRTDSSVAGGLRLPSLATPFGHAAASKAVPRGDSSMTPAPRSGWSAASSSAALVAGLRYRAVPRGQGLCSFADDFPQHDRIGSAAMSWVGMRWATPEAILARARCCVRGLPGCGSRFVRLDGTHWRCRATAETRSWSGPCRAA